MTAKLFESNLSYSVGTVSISTHFHFAGKVLDATEAGVVVNFTHGVFNGLVVEPSYVNSGDGSFRVQGISTFNDTVRVNASSEVNVDNFGVQSFDVNFVKEEGFSKKSYPVFSVNANGVFVRLSDKENTNPTLSVSSGRCAFGPNKVDLATKAAIGDVLCCVNDSGEFKPLNISDLSVLAKFPCALVCALVADSSTKTETSAYVFSDTFIKTKAFNGSFVSAQIWQDIKTEPTPNGYRNETFENITHKCNIKVVVNTAQDTFHLEITSPTIGAKYLTLIAMSV